MKTGTLIARMFLGGMFVISGINGFFHFIPTSTFISTMINTGDFYYVIKFFEIALGAMIMTGFYMPIALIMLFPISMDIFMYHIAHGTIPIAFMIMFAHIYMIYMHRDRYMHLTHA